MLVIAVEGVSGRRMARGEDALSVGKASGGEAIADDDIAKGFMESFRRQLDKKNVRQQRLGWWWEGVTHVSLQ